MAVGGSLQLLYELGVVNNHVWPKPLKGSEMKGWCNFPGILLSSFSLQQDFWSLHVSGSIHRRTNQYAYSHNCFICRSCTISSIVQDIPILKSTTLALTRSFNIILGGPLPLRLAPAIGIIVFSVWGFGLMCYGRNIFQNDNNSKKTGTHFAFDSYLQPLLFWTGAMLVCRTMDSIDLPSKASQAVKQRLLTFVRSSSTVLTVALCLSCLIQRTQKFFMKKNSSSDDARNMGFQFAGRAVYTAVWIAAFSLFMELLGFSTQKWLTAGGLGTVLLSLVGREIFTNFLSSVMIHATRPFIINDWIQTKIQGYEVSGTVEHVGWWSPTVIRGDDREAVHIPNHKFTVTVVRNLSQKTHWRIQTHLAISHLDANKISILVSCFVKTSRFEEYLRVKEEVLQDLLRVISHHRARLATPVRTFQNIYGDAVPFSTTYPLRRPSSLAPVPPTVHS